VPLEDKIQTSPSSNKAAPVLDKKVEVDCSSPETVPVPPSTNSENFPAPNSFENPLGTPLMNLATVPVPPQTSSETSPVVPPISSSKHPLSPKTFLRLYYAKQPVVKEDVTKSPASNSDKQKRPCECPSVTNACSDSVICNMCIQNMLDVAE
jgi:hypothetical protein